MIICYEKEKEIAFKELKDKECFFSNGVLYMKIFKFKFMLQERNGNMTDMKRLLEEVEELRSENEKLRNENSDLKYELENLKKECAKLHAKVKNN